MKNIKTWIENKGYKVEEIQFTENKKGLSVDTSYYGLYPGKEQFDALRTIQKYMNRFHPEYKVEPRGYYNAIYIY